MIDPWVITGVLLGVAILLILILWLRITAFIALLIASIAAGLIAGLDGAEVMDTVQKGMGSTLGFVATVVGLGAMFGAVLEKSGGAQAIARFLLQRMGTEKAPLAMVITGFVVAIPVFFDVAFIILIPVIYALQRATSKSLLIFAIPLLSGLAVTHAFIPPTPGPVAVADIIGADLGWIILAGTLAGIPTVLISGLWFGKYIGKKIFVEVPDLLVESDADDSADLPAVANILLIIASPILLILLNTMIQSGIIPMPFESIGNLIALIGHPFGALIIANLLVWYVLGIRRGLTSKELLRITSGSMAPAGTIILLTGAGGVFKQVLVDSGAGLMIAETLTEVGLPLIVFAFLAAALIRILQGSATVAMITAAGLTAPLMTTGVMYTEGQLAFIVIAIASGASILSHVNDSGFWLVKQYLGLSEKQTFRSWSVMTTILAVSGFISSYLLFLLF